MTNNAAFAGLNDSLIFRVLRGKEWRTWVPAGELVACVIAPEKAGCPEHPCRSSVHP